MYDVDYLSKLACKFENEAKKCCRYGCNVASLVLYGIALEALLLGMCFVYSNQVRKTKVYQKVKQRCIRRRIRKRGFILELNLNNLLEIAEQLNWLPIKEKVGDFGTFEDWVRLVKETRNLVHPACWLKPDKYFGDIYQLMRKRRGKTIKRFVNISEETVEVVRELLLNKVETDLRKELKIKQ